MSNEPQIPDTCPWGTYLCLRMERDTVWAIMVPGEDEPAGIYCSEYCAERDMVGPRFRKAKAVPLGEYAGHSQPQGDTPESGPGLDTVAEEPLTDRGGRSWFPIDTAPQDGSPVWVRGNDYGVDNGSHHYHWAWYDEADRGWKTGIDGGDTYTLLYLTHWMPLLIGQHAPFPTATGGKQ